MIDDVPRFRALLQQLNIHAWTQAAIGVLFETGLVDALDQARTVDELAAACPTLSAARIARCLAVVARVGVVVRDGEAYALAPDIRPFLTGPMRQSIQGVVRSQVMQPLAFLDGSAKAGAEGWSHGDPVLLKSQGDASALFPLPFQHAILPALGDLGERLEQPGARMLDVGVGVGALAIAMCRAFEVIRVVGIDVFDTALDLARAGVAAAGLEDRIELRRLAVEDLGDTEAYDLVWLPSFFVTPQVLDRALSRIRAALRPHGVVIFAMMSRGDDATGAVNDLVVDVWGGEPMTPHDAEARLRAAGFREIHRLALPPGAPPMVAARPG